MDNISIINSDKLNTVCNNISSIEIMTAKSKLNLGRHLTLYRYKDIIMYCNNKLNKYIKVKNSTSYFSSDRGKNYLTIVTDEGDIVNIINLDKMRISYWNVIKEKYFGLVTLCISMLFVILIEVIFIIFSIVSAFS